MKKHFYKIDARNLRGKICFTIPGKFRAFNFFLRHSRYGVNVDRLSPYAAPIVKASAIHAFWKADNVKTAFQWTRREAYHHDRIVARFHPLSGQKPSMGCRSSGRRYYVARMPYADADFYKARNDDRHTSRAYFSAKYRRFHKAFRKASLVSRGMTGYSKGAERASIQNVAGAYAAHTAKAADRIHKNAFKPSLSL